MKKRSLLLIVLTVLLAAIGATQTWAQNSTSEFQSAPVRAAQQASALALDNTYCTPDNALSFSYPGAWVLDNSRAPNGYYSIVSDPALAAQLQSQNTSFTDMTLNSGVIVITLYFADASSRTDGTDPLGAMTADIASGLQTVTFGTPEMAVVGSLPVARVSMTNNANSFDGMGYYFVVQNTLAQVAAFSAPGEYAAQTPTIEAIIASITAGCAGSSSVAVATAEATTVPTAEATIEATAEVTSVPTAEVTSVPTAEATAVLTAEATEVVVIVPPVATTEPTATPLPTTAPQTSEAIRQWASNATATSEYSNPSWGAMQASGAPDTTDCGDQSTAWASQTSDGRDTLTVYFAQPVIADQVNIYETYSPGAITRVELVPASGGAPVAVPNSADTIGTPCPGVFSVNTSAVDVGLVSAVNIVLDQTLTGSWNEIDAVELVGHQSGSTVPSVPGTLPPPPTLVLPTSIPTQEIHTISYGESAQGALTNGQPILYRFEGTSGDILTITLDSSDFDTYMQLFDASGSQIAYNDDSNGTLNSTINITLPSTGTFSISAGSFSQSASGAFTVTLTLNGSTPQGSGGGKGGGSPATGGDIAYGQTVNGVYSGGVQFYNFTGSVGDLVIISLDSPNFDCYLELHDATGTEVAYNDDGGSGLNSLLTTTLTSTGTYTIYVRSLSQTGSGGYTLALQGTAASAASSIEYGQTINGVYNGGIQFYNFTGNAGDVVTISLNSNQFDCYLELHDATGTEVAYNDDGGGSLNSLLTYALPSRGTYTIYVRSYSQSGAGGFTLALNSGSASTGGAIEYGQTVSGVYAGTDQYYTFTGNANDSVTIALNSAAFDPYLILNGPNGEVARNDDYSGLNSQITALLPTGGTYTIDVRSFSSGAGAYTLSLNGGAIQVTPIEYGQTVNGVYSGGIEYYTFSGTAGDVVSIALDAPTFDAYLELYDANNSQIAYNDDGGSGLNSLLITTLPATGTYTIYARALSHSGSGSFTLTLNGGTAQSLGMGGSIEYGQTLNGYLAGGEQYYTFTGHAGDVISISLNSSDFDCYLLLNDPTGQEAGRNDDGGGNLDSLLTTALNSNGTYTIVVTSYSRSGSGNFTLTLLNMNSGGGK